jgi:hypothetical protein
MSIPFTETFDTLYDSQPVEEAVGYGSLSMNIVPYTLLGGLRKFTIKNLMIHDSIATSIVNLQLSFSSMKLNFKSIASEKVTVDFNSGVPTFHSDETFVKYSPSTLVLHISQQFSVSLDKFEIKLYNKLKSQINIMPIYIFKQDNVSNELVDLFVTNSKIVDINKKILIEANIIDLLKFNEVSGTGTKVYLPDKQIVFTLEIS